MSIFNRRIYEKYEKNNQVVRRAIHLKLLWFSLSKNTRLCGLEQESFREGNERNWSYWEILISIRH
jgi:hypothetical protein